MVRSPPVLPASYNAKIHDLFIHTYAIDRHQIWRCTELQPLTWLPVLEGSQYHLAGKDSRRVLIVTEGGQPAWVLPDTVGRLYKHKVDVKG